MSWRIIQGDCVEVMRSLEEGSVDAIVTDPPYGLGFMGKQWDDLPPGVKWARECLRVLKAGGHLLAFGGTRTSHRLVCAIEDAGFEIRDCLAWLYGSGFPKSLDVSKAIDKAAGAERTEVVGARHRNVKPYDDETAGWNANNTTGDHQYTAPATPDAERWNGWGTALKPAHEPIVLARKPLAGTVAKNVLAHGTGALNVDGCRVGYEPGGSLASNPSLRESINGGNGGHVFPTEADRRVVRPNPAGRWPANVVLSHSDQCVEIGTRRVKPVGATARTEKHGMGQMFKGGKGKAHSGYRDADGLETVEAWKCAPGCPVRLLDAQTGTLTSGDTGGASRFFYCAKASSAERNAGLEDRNNHPTVKPIDLMRWLVRLITPPGGLVLDPFAGSGSTGIAALRESFGFVGIEREAEYVATARARIVGDAPLINGAMEDAA